MTDMPIHTGSAPAKTGSQPPAGHNAAPHSAQEFGNVLARQISNADATDRNGRDSKTPDGKTQSGPMTDGQMTNSQSPTAMDKHMARGAAKGGRHDKKTHADPLTADTGALPADMLSALLAQPVSGELAQAADGPPAASAGHGRGKLHALHGKPDARGGKAAVLSAEHALASGMTDAKSAAQGLPAGVPAANIGMQLEATGLLATGTGLDPAAVAPGQASDQVILPTGIKDKHAKPVRAGTELDADLKLAGKPGIAPDQMLHAAGKLQANGLEPAERLKTIKGADLFQAGNNPLIGLHGNEQQAALQPGGLASAATASPAHAYTLHSQPGSPAWRDEFGQKITWLAGQQNQTAELHLNPPQLGPLDVVLKMHGDQATAVFSSPHAAVREAVEQAIPRLREILADSGIMLGNASVNDQAPQKNQDHAPRHAHRSEDEADILAGSSAVHETTTPLIRRHNGLVDTFV